MKKPDRDRLRQSLTEINNDLIDVQNKMGTVTNNLANELLETQGTETLWFYPLEGFLVEAQVFTKAARRAVEDSQRSIPPEDFE